jgi:hypothetical protein
MRSTTIAKEQGNVPFCRRRATCDYGFLIRLITLVLVRLVPAAAISSTERPPPPEGAAAKWGGGGRRPSR